MELPLRPVFEDKPACGVEVLVEFPEVVMDGRGAEDPDTLAFAQLVFEVGCLDDDAETLDEENAAEDGEQQFLVDDDGTHTDDTADHQRPRVAHEHLCGIGVVPEKTNHRSDEGTEEDHQFLRSRDIHDVEVGGILDVTAHIGEYAQCHSDDGGVAGAHAVHAVVEVGSVAHRGYHEDGDDDEEQPSGGILVLAHEGEGLRIVEVMVFHEGNGGHERFLGL